MGKIKATATSFNFQKSDSEEHCGVTIPALCSFFVQLGDELKNRLKSYFKGSIKDEDKTTSAISIRKHKESSSIFEVSLEKQLQAWKENPIWEDQSPDIKVTVPKGSLSHLNLKVDVGLPPDAVFNILIDPDNKRVFKNIKEVRSRRVLVDEGTRQVVELEQAALWRFLWWSGTISVHVLVDQNREDYSVRTKFFHVCTRDIEKSNEDMLIPLVFLIENLSPPKQPKQWSRVGGEKRRLHISDEFLLNFITYAAIRIRRPSL